MYDIVLILSIVFPGYIETKVVKAGDCAWGVIYSLCTAHTFKVSWNMPGREKHAFKIHMSMSVSAPMWSSGCGALLSL